MRGMATELDLIAEIYPDARVLHIIRDGRAVTRSLLALPNGPSTIEDAAEEWRESVAAFRSGSRAVRRPLSRDPL